MPRIAGLLAAHVFLSILSPVRIPPSDSAISRRQALTVLAGAATGALVGCAGVRSDDKTDDAGGGGMSRAIGIQLYTVRTLMKKDAEGTLAALREIGYREVELAGLYGRTPGGFAALLDRHELKAPSGHVGLDDLRRDLPQQLDDAGRLGLNWLVCPWIDQSERTPDGYRKVADDLNDIGLHMKEAGKQLAYHNHDFEFAPLADGSRGYDILLQRCDKTLVDMELDLFWITKGGLDPRTYLDAHPARFPLVHAKDMDAAGNMVDVGAGQIPFKSLLSGPSASGLRHVFVEHDEPASPLESARKSYAATREILKS